MTDEVWVPVRPTPVSCLSSVWVSRARQIWAALVELKTNRNDLITARIEANRDVAREQQFDAVLHRRVTAPGEHAVAAGHRPLRKVDLFHLSWSQIQSEAVTERAKRSVSVPGPTWILGELIRYLEHSRSGGEALAASGGTAA